MHKRIAILIDRSSGMCEDLVRGVTAFAATERGWHLRWIPPLREPLRVIGSWDPAGVIACLPSKKLATLIRALHKPTVNVCGAVSLPGVPLVALDHRPVGSLAAEHLLARGFRNLACLSAAGRQYFKERMCGFIESTEAAGLRSHVHIMRHFGPNGLPLEPDTGLMQWLRRLPTPVGVFAVCDDLGILMSQLAVGLGIAVPEEMALVGADDHETLCRTASPPLSSVRLPAVQIGYEAAALLKRQMKGQAESETTRLLRPTVVTDRESSNTIATTDPHLIRAMAFIRLHAHQQISVDDVLRKVRISRRLLEQKFHTLLGRTPAQEICRMHIQLAKQMLTDSDESLSRVARKCGFGSPAYFSVVFSKAAGVTPLSYRRYHTAHGTDLATHPART